MKTTQAKTTDFAVCLTEFLKIYLPGKRELSENTIKSYRDTFRFMLIYSEEKLGIYAEKLMVSDITENFVYDFMCWLEDNRKNSRSTRRQRLAAIHVFVHFLKTKKPENLLEYQKILDIKVKGAGQHNIKHLSPDEVRAILAAPDLADRFGRRDMVLLSLLYDSAARVQGICDLTVGNVRLQRPATVKLTEKWGKTRIVPLMSETADILKAYLRENNLDTPEKRSLPLFFNHQGTKLTRAGVTYILQKYCDIVRKDITSLPKVSPHTFRHQYVKPALKIQQRFFFNQPLKPKSATLHSIST